MLNEVKESLNKKKDNLLWTFRRSRNEKHQCRTFLSRIFGPPKDHRSPKFLSKVSKVFRETLLSICIAVSQ